MDRDKAEAELTILEQQQAGLEADIETLNVQVKNFERDLEGAQANLEDAQTALGVAEDNLKTAETDRQQAELEAEGAKAEVEQAQIELETVQKELEDSQQELITAQAELETTQTELETVQTELGAKQAELDSTQLALANAEKARDEAVQARAEAQAQQETLSEENEKLNGFNTELEALNANLRNQVSIQNTDLKSLEDRVEALSNQLLEQASALELAQSQAQAVNSRSLTYTVNQVVHTGVLDAQDLPAIRAQFAELLSQANDKAVQTRAGDVTLDAEQIESIIQASLQTPGADVVTLRSKQNQYVSEPLSVTVEVAENRMLLEEGQLVVTQQIHLGSPEFQEQRDSVRSDLSKLFISANSTLLAKGLADGVYPVTSETSLEIEGFTNQLLRLSGPVVVGLTASDDIYSGGPAKLEFIILN